MQSKQSKAFGAFDELASRSSAAEAIDRISPELRRIIDPNQFDEVILEHHQRQHRTPGMVREGARRKTKLDVLLNGFGMVPHGDYRMVDAQSMLIRWNHLVILAIGGRG